MSAPSPEQAAAKLPPLSDAQCARIATLLSLPQQPAKKAAAMTRKRPRGVSRAIWAAYGDHYPGGAKRAEEQRLSAEHLAAWRERDRRDRAAHTLWERVHPELVKA